MNKVTRVKKIEEIIKRDKNDPFGKLEIPWEDSLVSMNVYKIPLSYLIYNKYNGRILSRTKSLEKQKHNIDVETTEGKTIIEGLLWKSKIDRNKRTLKSIAARGQEKVGIITKDGIVIDGNRRVMLLNKIQKFDYFKAVVLPVTLDENPLEIEKLETSYQMGEDEKLGYNATEKYLKAKELYTRLTCIQEIDSENLDKDAVEKIANWMGENNSEVETYLRTMVVMDAYLENFDYAGIYTQLDDREDQFLQLNKWLKSFYGETSKKPFNGYSDDDIDDLKWIAFTYLRIRREYDGKEFRNLAGGQSENNFLGNKEIWKQFRDTHANIIRNLPEEIDIDFNSKDLASHLNDRDKKYFESSQNADGENLFLENLRNCKQLIGYQKASNAPEKLVKQAHQTFDAIKTNHKSFKEPKVQKLVQELGNKIFDSLKDNSPKRVLAHIIELLEDIENSSSDIPDYEHEEVRLLTKEIQKIGYRINKNI